LLLLLLLDTFASTGSDNGSRVQFTSGFRYQCRCFPRHDLLKGIEERVTQLRAGALWAALGAAWATLNGTWAMMVGLNRAYQVKEERR
jgi:hypothetical protein